ncbi:hypothetical protein PG999_003819 [Apiospora kogelbergensis]|uniref:Polyketide cyclase / dehydrase and lipid transport n=1 Tax=Apiospora kogelbergensis TaxID=1337665 RepID=A0AAW0R4U0_9PEZI
MPSLSNLSALAGFLSLAAVAVDAKPVGYTVTPQQHGSSANATTGSSSHHYDTTAKNVTISSVKNGTTYHDDNGGINWAALRCPQNMDGGVDGILPTPTYGTEGRVWMVCSETLIRAPRRAVYDALVDFGRYGKWNSYVTNVEVVHPTSKAPLQNSDDPAHKKAVYEGMDLSFTFTGLGGEGVVTTGPEVLTVLNPSSSSSSGRSSTSAIKATKPRKCRHSASTFATSEKKAVAATGEEDYSINAWRSDLKVADELIRSEHPNVLTDAGEGFTRYVSWETYYEGKSTETFKMLQTQMQALNDQQGQDLKAYLEKKN